MERERERYLQRFEVGADGVTKWRGVKVQRQQKTAYKR